MDVWNENNVAFSTLDGNFKCGVSQEYSGQYECIPLSKCERDITRHLEMYGLSEDPSLESEMKLLLASSCRSVNDTWLNFYFVLLFCEST